MGVLDDVMQVADVPIALLLLVLLRTFQFTDNDDHIFARSMQYPPPTADAYRDITNHVVLYRLKEADPIGDRLPLVTRLLAEGLAHTEIGASAPLEVLPAVISNVEVLAMLIFIMATSSGVWRSVRVIAGCVALACSPPVQGPVLALALSVTALLDRSQRGTNGSFASYLLAAFPLVILVLSESLYASFVIAWLLGARRAGLPIGVATVFVLGVWQVAEAASRMLSPAADLFPTDPARLAGLLRHSVWRTLDTSLFVDEPHFGNSWQMYQLLFTRYHLGTRIATAVLSVVPALLVSVFSAARVTNSPGSVANACAVAVLATGTYGRWMHPSQLLLAFVFAPELFLRMRFGFFVAGASVVLVPLLISYRYAWLELGSMPQPNMPFYGGTFYAFTVAITIVQLCTRIFTEARVRTNLAASLVAAGKPKTD
jgi:uncharacterized membrane protein